MEVLTNFYSKEAVQKLKHLVAEIDICLFCTNIKTDDGATCRPMSTQKVDEDGNLWFFSNAYSDKNKEIKHNKQVQLFYAHPGKSAYLVVNGQAEIVFDKNKIEELWTPLVKVWFADGKEDSAISLIKVNTKSAYYWDTDGSKMINFLKMVASVATGTTLDIGKEGSIKV